MTYKESGTVIGFSAFNIFEECYEYNENACYIADSLESAKAFVENSLMSIGDFRIDAVTIVEIMNEYGVSCGEFAMTSAAFRRFLSVSAANAIRFRATPYDGDESLMVVYVEGVQFPDET